MAFFGLLACGVAFCLVPLWIDAAWFQRHVALPAFFRPPPPWLHTLFRAVPVAIGVTLALGARWLSRLRTADAARTGLAILLACTVAEARLRGTREGVAPWRAKKIELRIGRPDARYGWVLLPSRTSRAAPSGAASVAYAIDAWGDRAADGVRAPDASKPTLVVTGESIAVGHGLPFEQTFAARLSSALGLQLVNVAAGGYGTDQALLRLADVLPRLSLPVAVVMVVPLLQLERNVQDYRPRLVLREGGLALVPGADSLLAQSRLRDLLVNEVPLLGEAKLRRALGVTAAELHEAAAVARAHGAEPIFLVPSVGPQRSFADHPEAQLLRPLFVDQALPFVLADVEPAELLPVDGHPNAAASLRIARLLENALRPRLFP